MPEDIRREDVPQRGFLRVFSQLSLRDTSHGATLEARPGDGGGVLGQDLVAGERVVDAGSAGDTGV